MEKNYESVKKKFEGVSFDRATLLITDLQNDFRSFDFNCRKDLQLSENEFEFVQSEKFQRIILAEKINLLSLVLFG